MRAANDEREPELQHIETGAIDAGEVEELRLAIRAVVVVYGHFDNPEAAILNFLHHLQTNDAAVLFQAHAIEDRSPHHAEITIDVPHSQAEHELHDVVVHAADEEYDATDPSG